MVAGAWVLVLLPLMDVLQAFGWASKLPAPNVFGYGAVRTLSDTLIWGAPIWSGFPGVYELLAFCIGVVLLFSKERGRRRSRMDWTRRWGVLCSYVVLLLGAAFLISVAALVLAGITAVFHSMPLQYQPGATQLFADLSAGYLRYGAQPMFVAAVVRLAFSSITIVLACFPLFDALRSSGSKRLAAILLAPLALFSLIQLAQAGRCCYSLGVSSFPSGNYFCFYAFYFSPALLVGHVADVPVWPYHMPGSEPIAFLVEAAKWCIVLAIALWLTIAQLAAWRQQKKRERSKELRWRSPGFPSSPWRISHEQHDAQG